MTDPIAHQYEEWSYPLPIDDMQEAIRTGAYWEIGDPLTYWPLFWPAKRGVGTPDILVAGCGTNQAAYYALRHPDSRVIAIDLSEHSLAHEQRLKDRHGLDNLTLLKMDLVDVADLGQDFDFITSTGVLHHLPDPVAGLTALRSVLRPEGVVNVMVYGTSLRLGVYMMQDLFRTMGLQQVPEDVEIVRAVVTSLPQRHVLRKYLDVAPDLEYDAGMVDTFLNRRDRSYDVLQVYDLAHAAGLEFLTWCDPLEYSLASHVPADHVAWRRLSDLNERDAAHACDLLTQIRGTHRFALAHPDFVAAQRIPFESERFLDCTVRLHADAQRLDPPEGESWPNPRFTRRGYGFEVDSRLLRLLDAMADGTTDLGGALRRLELSAEEQARYLDLARSGFASLRSQGHVFVLLPR